MRLSQFGPSSKPIGAAHRLTFQDVSKFFRRGLLMSKRPKSLSDRLILLVARLGERATVHNITGWHLTGAALQQAKVDAEGLVKWEEVYQTRFVGRHNLARRSQKPSLTAVLTKAGIWRAAQLGVPYRHDLVATLLAQKDHPTPHSRSEKEHAAETAALVED